MPKRRFDMEDSLQLTQKAKKENRMGVILVVMGTVLPFGGSGAADKKANPPNDAKSMRPER